MPPSKSKPGRVHRAETETGRELLEIYRLLLESFGPRHWWPGSTPFEVMIGAILTQNTAWSNVVKAVDNLKAESLLSPEAMAKADIRVLRRLVKPSRYFNQKAERVRIFSRFFVNEYGGDPSRMAEEDTGPLREKLLALKGVGPETADSMLLYGLDKPVFVVDAYTRRAFHRLGYLPEDADYYATRELFSKNLPCDVELYNDFHAQIVQLGADYCKPGPKCDGCPLAPLGRCRVS